MRNMIKIIYETNTEIIAILAILFNTAAGRPLMGAAYGAAVFDTWPAVSYN